MHKLTFYPVGNGDTSQIVLGNGKRILFDFRHMAKAESDETPAIDLISTLSDELRVAKRDYYDVVAFTHADDDHIQNSTTFFELDHAKKYQGDSRIKIKELWVPAAVILEECETRDSEVALWRQEARHRLREGYGIKVFSKPDALKSWCEKNNVDFDSRKKLMVDAGTVVDGFSIAADGVEFFCHSPFIKHTDGDNVLRNSCTLIFNVRFSVNSIVTDYLAIGDTDYEILSEIVSVTEYHNNTHRLAWDIFNIPHHCSYKALGRDKGTDKTKPDDGVAKLLMMGKEGAHIISSSFPIPDNADAYEREQPPHIQARITYEEFLEKIGGCKFYVTMEEPNIDRPEPMVFIIDSNGIHRESLKRIVGASVIDRSPPRAG